MLQAEEEHSPVKRAVQANLFLCNYSSTITQKVLFPPEENIDSFPKGAVESPEVFIPSYISKSSGAHRLHLGMESNS